MLLQKVLRLVPQSMYKKKWLLLFFIFPYIYTNTFFDIYFDGMNDQIGIEEIIEKVIKLLPKKKNTTIIIYLAGVNNLGFFLRKNLSQIAKIGSSSTTNILVQLDVLLSGNKKVTKRYYVEKNKLILLNNNDPETQSVDSGDPNSLINWCSYCIKNYPAQHYILGLSNHATGIIDIGQVRAINPSELFTFNPNTNMIELNRKQHFLEFITQPNNQRGLFFDDVTGHYLTNAKLDYALKTICQNHLKGMFDLVIFDACLQQMHEIALYMKNYAKIMLGSEEVILAPGLDYENVLEPFFNKPIDIKKFAQHTVKSYENTYKKITQDYTFSAIDLTLMHYLEENVNTVASLLTQSILNRKTIIKEIIKTSRHKQLCTNFHEPSYIDLGHFYLNLLSNLERFKFKADKNDKELQELFNNLIVTIKEGLAILKAVVLASTTGNNLANAQGLAIYFPEYGNKHASYSYSHAWSVFLDHYLHFV